MHISQNWTTKEQVFPISLQTSEFETNLLNAPKTLKDLVKQHQQKGHILDKSNRDNNKHSFFNNIIMVIFLFIAATISLLATIAIIHLVCKHTKLKSLVTGIAFHPIKLTEALLDKENILQNCTAQWYTIAALTLMIIGLVIYVTPMKFRVISGISTVFSYIGQCDLLNTCFGLLHVWYTPGGSMCRICHLTSKESIFTLIRSY